MKYHALFVAGTFDHLHSGHEAVLAAALLHGDTVTIGITSDVFIAGFKKINQAVPIQPFAKRKEQLLAWVKDRRSEERVTIIRIDDPYEPAVSGSYDALITTVQNRVTAEEINTRRRAAGLPPLILIDVPLVAAHDELPISSTRIRSGEIDGKGNLYLPDSLRIVLKEPLGTIIASESITPGDPETILVTVGDVTTDQFVTKGIIPSLSIIDLHARRKPFKELQQFSFPEEIHIVHLKSGPGYISVVAREAIDEWKQHPKPTVIVVQGEDDLLVLPAILAVPVGSMLYYGQPNVGIVEVRVTPEIQRIAAKYLHQFIR